MPFRPSDIARLQNAVAATGNGTSFNVNGLAAVCFQVLGTFTATVTFEGTVDGATWASLKAYPTDGGAGASAVTTPGIWVAPCAGLTRVRARVTWTSGTSVTVLASAIPGTAVAPGTVDVSGSELAITQTALTPTHTAVTVDTSSDQVLAENTDRKYALIVNDGTVDVYLKIGATAVAHQGIRLAAGGGAYEMGPAFGNLMTDAINGITASGSAVVMATEGE